MRRKIISEKKFFNREAEPVARDLLGKFIIRKIGDREISSMIIETEAYGGENDKASHASKGKTKRNAPMWGIPGSIYVYLCYGMYYMLNVVTGEFGHPSAVLIRGVSDISGPGRVGKFLKINKKLNGLFLGKEFGIWIEDRGVKVHISHIKSAPRVGVDYAGPLWSKKHLRFILI